MPSTCYPRFVDHEYVDPSDMEMRGVLAGIGIIKDRSFSPDAPTRDLLDKAARTASRIGHAISYQPSAMVPNGLYYSNRRWINPFSTNATFTADTYNIIDARTAFFTYAHSASPSMAINAENVGTKYPAAYVDANGNFLRGSQAYVLHLPPPHSSCKLLVDHGLRSHQRLRSRQRPSLSVAQYDG